MANFQFEAGLGRREALRLAALTSAAFWAESYAWAASDFWNKKKPADWTDQEKEELRTKSPWAKKVDAESSGGGGRGGGGGGAGGGGGGGADGGGGGGRSRGGGGGGGGSRGGGGGGVAPAANFGGGQSASLVVVWQSAKPVQDAHPLALPPKLDNHYVISVTGIPPQTLNAVMMGRGGARGGSGGRQFGGGRGGGRNGGGGGGGDVAGAGPAPGAENVDNAGPPAAPADPTAGLRRGATLTAKGKEVQNSDVVMAMNNNMTVLFAFAKEALPLTVADKEVEFDLKLGNLSAKAKFSLKDMMYGEQLAL